MMFGGKEDERQKREGGERREERMGIKGKDVGENW